ncbi:MAG: hypothetical protein NZ519_03055 [Bacteroidia bacterium]|nr:hypothetical protein [Bacteroidia bacterium]
MPARAVRSVSEVPKRSAVRNAPTLALARGTPKKTKKFFQTCMQIALKSKLRLSKNLHNFFLSLLLLLLVNVHKMIDLKT